MAMFRPYHSYPDNEARKLDELESLYREWHTHFENVFGPERANGMVFDGFYPFYFSMVTKVLFIAWESRDIEGLHYCDVLTDAYRTGKRIGGRHLNRDKFNSRILRIPWGLLKGMPAWSNVPSASCIGDSFATDSGISFATINISKFSNPGGHSADWRAIEASFGASIHPRNFLAEQIGVLEPDIIITMNMEPRLVALGGFTSLGKTDDVEIYSANASRALLLNCWHFAARKPAEGHFYNPICDAVKRYRATEAVN